MRIDAKPPWSSQKLRKLGKAIREGREHDATDPRYDDVVVWYDDLQTAVQKRLRQMDFSPVLGDQSPNVTGRPKTIDTLRRKLVDHPSWVLPSIFDIAGVRLEASMHLAAQDSVARMIAAEFGCDYEVVASDSRSKPHSGYRALHLRLVLPAGRVEVQVRTALQGRWANLYEVAADLMGREIRYGHLPEKPGDRVAVFHHQLTSATIAGYEVLWTAIDASDGEWTRVGDELKGLFREAAEREASLGQQILATLPQTKFSDEMKEGFANDLLRAVPRELSRPSKMDNVPDQRFMQQAADLRRSVREAERDFVAALQRMRETWLRSGTDRR